MTLVQELAAAEQLADGRDYITQTKAAITRHLKQIDPLIEVEDTQYFNHSAIPDFAVTWGRERGSRPVFLRGSYAAIAVEQLQLGGLSEEPVVIALTDSEGPSVEFEGELAPPIPDALFASAKDQLRYSKTLFGTRALITDSAALDQVEVAPTGSEASTPLTSAVRANFLRGGRGLIDSQKVQQLTGSWNIDGVALASDVQANFAPAAVARMGRLLQLVRLAFGHDLNLLDSNDDEPTTLEQGRLSSAELQDFLPWLLRSSGVTDDSRFWRHLGSLIRFDDLLAIGPVSSGPNLDPLIKANAESWRGVRSFIGLRPEPHAEDDGRESEFRWSIGGGTLRGQLMDKILHVAADGKFLHGRKDLPLPAWEALQETPVPFALQSVELKGVDRSVSVAAESGRDLRGDVDGIADAFPDSRFFVSQIGLRSPVRSGTGASEDVIDVFFARDLVVARKSASVAALIKCAAEVLGRDDLNLRLAAIEF